MRSDTSFSPARRIRRAAAQRSRRRPVLAVGAVALALLATAGMAGAAPASQASESAPHFALASLTTPLPAVVTTAPPSDVAIEAQETLEAAEASLASAAAVTADIQASGLDVGDPDPTVDTASLTSAVERLQDAEDLPEPLVPDFTEDVVAAIAAVEERASLLRGALEGAQQRKAADEAAEKARLEAEAAAAAAAAEAESTQAKAPSTSIPTAPAAASASAAEAQAIARGMLASRGWGEDQFSCLVSLWHKESGWNAQAMNRSSGAYGIPQALPGSKMASAGADWQTNAATQISWGFGYIAGRYGTPCSAWSHSQSVGWY